MKFWKRPRAKRRWLVLFKRWISQVLGNVLNVAILTFSQTVFSGLNGSVQRIPLRLRTNCRIPFLFLRRGKRGKRRVQRPPIPRTRWESCPWWTLRPDTFPGHHSEQFSSAPCKFYPRRSTNLCVEISTRPISNPIEIPIVRNFVTHENFVVILGDFSRFLSDSATSRARLFFHFQLSSTFLHILFSSCLFKVSMDRFYILFIVIILFVNIRTLRLSEFFIIYEYSFVARS